MKTATTRGWGTELQIGQAAGRQRSAYRPEIDGLRAFAVLSVMVYHADERWLRGGLAGVDVFFVISGYLITRRILEDHDRGAFSLAGFWMARVRRIAPALLLVLGVSGLLGIALLPPAHLMRFASATLASVFSVSNFYFRETQGNYFSPDSRTNPLIHTWSLGVEEQFYLFYPLVMLLALRFVPRLLPGVLLAGIAASLLMARHLQHDHAGMGFYLLPGRAWEFLLGAVAVLSERRGLPARLPDGWATIMASAALAGLCAAFLIAGGQQVFPWPRALVPSLATTGLIIFLRPDAWPARFLAAAPFVFIGTISYSLYLWHQSAFAFVRLAQVKTVSPLGYIVLGIGLIAISWLSWRFVEQPFRKQQRASSRRTLAITGAGACLLVAFSLAIHAGDGWRFRFPADVLVLMDQESSVRSRKEECQRRGSAGPNCVFHTPFPASVAVIGDSHARSLVRGLGPLAIRKGIAVEAVWKSGCIPTLSGSTVLSPGRVCNAFMDRASRQLAATPGIVRVIVMARWAAHLEQSAFDNGEGGIEVSPWADRPPLTGAELAKVREGLIQLIVRLQKAGKQVVMVGPVPEAGWNVPEILWKAKLYKGSDNVTTSYEAVRRRTRFSMAVLAEVAARTGVMVIDPRDAFCRADTGRCAISWQGMPFYSDDNHVNRLGAEWIARRHEDDLLGTDFRKTAGRNAP
jgi:peptidoglycan/LPS O-acetylase OafA/YrhL